MKTITITPEIINQVKNLLNTTGVNDIARRVGVSQYTVSMIKKGKYDQDGPLQDTWGDKRCPITGFLTYEKY